MNNLKMSIEVIDPFMKILENLAKAGEESILEKARNAFTENDEVLNLVRKLKKDTTVQQETVIDLSSFVFFGSNSMKNLVTISKTQTLTIVIDENIYDIYSESDYWDYFDRIIVNSEKIIVKLIPSSNSKSELMRGEIVHTSFIEIRKLQIGESLIKHAKDAAKKPDSQNSRFSLPDGTSANLWIDVKSILSDPSVAFEFAYYCAYFLTNGFRYDYAKNKEERSYDSLVVGNNTAFLLGCFVQRILPKLELFMIDRLGPFPRVSTIGVFQKYEKMRGKNILILEDVVSTGREIDLITLFGYLHDANVNNALCIFNLQVMNSVFFDPKNIVSLSYPAKDLEYERLPSSFVNLRGI